MSGWLETSYMARKGVAKGKPGATHELTEAKQGKYHYVYGPYAEPVLIETYLPGPEFTVAVLGNGDEARCLPIVGMNFDTLPRGAPPIYGYEAKWLWDSPAHPLEIFDCPARITESLAEDIRAAALAAYRALECRDWCRIDIRCDADGRPSFIECNPLAGLRPKWSELTQLAALVGLSYETLIGQILDEALVRVPAEPALVPA